MLRRLATIGVAVVSAAFAFWLAQDLGQATLIIRGYEVRTSVVALGFVVLLLGVGFAGALWMLDVPNRLRRASDRSRRERGVEALEQALIAAASGDGRAAKKEAARAEQLLDRAAASRLIAAQASEALGDVVGAESQYAAMLADPRTEVVGRRGLAGAALARRDYGAAILHAREAAALQPQARWTFDVLFDAQVRSRAWEDAIETLAWGLKLKHLGEPVARRRRAVLLCATAAELERREPHRARDLAEQAASQTPAFAPGAALAARLLVEAGKAWRAASLLEDAWTAAPHPALALAYRDLKPDEPERARAKRLVGLAEMNPAHRESRILIAEQAITIGDAVGAEAALSSLIEADGPASARLCGLMAQAAQLAGRAGEARGWLARAALAPGEPDWSDLDPEGPAFAYMAEDWARLVYSFGDTGALIHPRHERYERQRLTAPTTLQLGGPADAEPARPTEPATGSTAPGPSAKPDTTTSTVSPRAITPLAPSRQPDDPGPDAADD